MNNKENDQNGPKANFEHIYLQLRSVLVGVVNALKMFSHICLLSFICIAYTGFLRASLAVKYLSEQHENRQLESKGEL